MNQLCFSREPEHSLADVENDWTVLSLQDSDRDWSGLPPDVPRRAGLSEQRRVACWFKLELDGICSSQMALSLFAVHLPRCFIQQ